MAQAATTELSPERWRRTSTLDEVSLYSTCGLLLFGPLAFGATEPWAIFILEAGSAILFFLWAFRRAQSGELQLSGNPLFAPMLVFAAVIVAQLWTGRSAYRYQTISNLRLYCAYAVLAFLVVQLLRRTSQIQKLARIFSIYGSALAVFALIQSMTSDGKLYWIFTPGFGGWIYGPYVNHNHYAGLMELLVPIPLVLSLNDRVHSGGRRLALVAAALMASSIFLSGSRGGMAAFTVEIVILGGFVLRRDRLKMKRPVMAMGLFAVILMALLAWLGGGEVMQRIATIHEETQTELSGGTRLDIDRDALKMFLQKPVLGWGLGVFADVYPEFRSFSTNFTINAAHNDYLQLLVETGALGFMIMLWFVLAMYRAAVRKLSNWTSDINGALALAAMLGCTGILIHSLVDFNLQVPANAAMFYVLAAVAAMEPRFGRGHHRPSHYVGQATRLSA